jgi:ankyrin repeat protein
MDLIKQLLAGGANPNIQDEVGQTALMKAVLQGNTEMTTLLLSKKNDLNLKDKKGQTALALAIENNQGEIVNILKKAGAKN